MKRISYYLLHLIVMFAFWMLVNILSKDSFKFRTFQFMDWVWFILLLIAISAFSHKITSWIKCREIKEGETWVSKKNNRDYIVTSVDANKVFVRFSEDEGIRWPEEYSIENFLDKFKKNG